MFVVSSSRDSLFKGLKLQKGDRVKRFNDQLIRTRKHFIFRLKRLKTNERFNLIVKRNKKYFNLKYKVKSKKLFEKKSYKLLKISAIEKSDISKYVKTNKLFNKYKHKLQKAYTLQVDSFIYTRPHFDAERTYSLPPGQIVTISKKIYYPANRFGSFYKIYVKKPKKIVGYISEVDVVPQFIKQKGEYVSNPRFKLASRYKGNLDEANYSLSSRGEDLQTFTSNNFRLMGLSATLPLIRSEVYVKNIRYGIHISMYNFPFLYFNSDMNLSVGFDANNLSGFPNRLYMEFLHVFEKLKLLQKFSVRTGIGVGSTLNIARGNKIFVENILASGLLGIKTSLTPLFFLTIDFRPALGYQFKEKEFLFKPNILFSLQIPF